MRKSSIKYTSITNLFVAQWTTWGDIPAHCDPMYFEFSGGGSPLAKSLMTCTLPWIRSIIEATWNTPLQTKCTMEIIAGTILKHLQKALSGFRLLAQCGSAATPHDQTFPSLYWSLDDSIKWNLDLWVRNINPPETKPLESPCLVSPARSTGGRNNIGLFQPTSKEFDLLLVNNINLESKGYKMQVVVSKTDKWRGCYV